MPFLSRHIGSVPGEGPSGMHVQPFVPLRKTFIVAISITVASLATAAGAAARALLILAASVVGGATGPTFGAAPFLSACADCADGSATEPAPRHNSTTTHARVNRKDTFHLPYRKPVDGRIVT